MTNPHRPNDTPNKQNEKRKTGAHLHPESHLRIGAVLQRAWIRGATRHRSGKDYNSAGVLVSCCLVLLLLAWCRTPCCPPRTASCNVSECPLSSFTFPCFCLVLQGRAASSSYNSKIRNGTLILGIVEALEKSPGAMGDVKKTHFRLMKVWYHTSERCSTQQQSTVLCTLHSLLKSSVLDVSHSPLPRWFSSRLRSFAVWCEGDKQEDGCEPSRMNAHHRLEYHAQD